MCMDMLGDVVWKIPKWSSRKPIKDSDLASVVTKTTWNFPSKLHQMKLQSDLLWFLPLCSIIFSVDEELLFVWKADYKTNAIL